MSSIPIPMPQSIPLPASLSSFNLLFPNVYSSEGTDKILPALFAALEAISPAAKDSENPHFHSKYADLGSNYDAAKPALHANKIRVLQPPVVEGAKVIVATILLHESGQWIASLLEMTSVNDPQAIGKTITYARRYAFNGLLGMVAEDDDGNAGSGINGLQQTGRPARVPSKPGPVPAPQGTPELCADCSKEIKPIKGADGKMHTVESLIDRSHRMYSRKLCGKCQAKAAEQAKQKASADIGVPAEGAAPTTAAAA